MDRAEHLQWCKDRAIEYVELGDYEHAISSMISDLKKCPEIYTYNNKAVNETIRILLANPPLTEEKIRQWIRGFR